MAGGICWVLDEGAPGQVVPGQDLVPLPGQDLLPDQVPVRTRSLSQARIRTLSRGPVPVPGLAP